jgi:uncharacterized protein YneF (UPF0154 family)
MNVLILPLFISFILVIGAILGYLYLVNKKEFEHQDEASLMPLDDD